MTCALRCPSGLRSPRCCFSGRRVRGSVRERTCGAYVYGEGRELVPGTALVAEAGRFSISDLCLSLCSHKYPSISPSLVPLHCQSVRMAIHIWFNIRVRRQGPQRRTALLPALCCAAVAAAAAAVLLLPLLLCASCWPPLASVQGSRPLRPRISCLPSAVPKQTPPTMSC